MYDVFISHSSLDKPTIVKPLVDQLIKAGLEVWYDQNNIAKGDIIREDIITGINESVVFVPVITKHFFESSWSSLELGILQTISPKNLIPIIDEDAKNIVGQKYPFLLEHNYIQLSYPLQKVADEIKASVLKKKHECGFWHINKTNLKSLIKEMRTYNDFKLEQLAIQLNALTTKIITDPKSTLIDLKLVMENVLNYVAYRENIYLDNVKSSIDLFIDIDFLSNNMKEHIKFLKRICQYESIKMDNLGHWTQSNLYLIQFSMFSIIEWYMFSYFKKPSLSEKTIIPVSPEEYTYDDILQSYEIEKLVLPPHLIAEPSEVAIWNEHNPLTFIGARDALTGKLVGFFNTLPISDTLYEEILSGDFDDTRIDTKHIRTYDLPGFYKLYLCSFCIHPAYNTTSAFRIIYNNFIDFLLQLAEQREIFISDIVADGVTQKGEILCESIGMKNIKNTSHNSKVYCAKLIPPELSTLTLNNRNGRRLIACYERIYTQFKDLF